MQQCRHTFALCSPFFSWRHCSLCFVLMLPLSGQVYHCARCGRVLHQGCLGKFLQLSDKGVHHEEALTNGLKDAAKAELPKRDIKLWTSFREFMRQQEIELMASHPPSGGSTQSWPFVSFFSEGGRSPVPHRHHMMPCRFYYPTSCSHCLSSGEGQKKDSGGEARSASTVPKNKMLGFGKRGYRCVTCHFALHSECLHALDPVMYELAKDHIPDAEGIPRMNSTEESSEKKNASPTDAEGIPSAVVFIASLLFDTKDPNTMLILRDSIALLQRLSNRHPSIGITSLNPYNVAELSKRDAELYKASCDSLQDAEFMRSEGPEGPTMRLLREMMRYATAVYGYAYKSGLLSSVAGGVASRSIRRDVLYVDAATNNKAVMDILALPSATLVMSRWSQNALEPTYCIIVDHEARRIVLSFRGTLSDGDLLTDICAYGDPFAGGYAHQGAARIVAAMFDHRTSSTAATNAKKMEGGEDGKETEHKETENERVGSELRGPTTADGGIDAILALTKLYTDYDIFVTGHSLGGGVALLFGVRAIREKIFGESATQRMRVIAFGAMPVLTMPAAQSYENQIWSVVNGCDAVCRMQLNSFDRLAAELSRAAAPASKDTDDMTEEMHHPGRVLMLTTKCDNATNRIVEVPHGHISMHHLFISSGMVKIHFMDAYSAALREVHLRTPEKV